MIDEHDSAAEEDDDASQRSGEPEVEEDDVKATDEEDLETILTTKLVDEILNEEITTEHLNPHVAHIPYQQKEHEMSFKLPEAE